MAMVSQEPILFDCSIKENIVYGLPKGSVTDNEIEKVAREANIHSFITDLPQVNTIHNLLTDVIKH